MSPTHKLLGISHFEARQTKGKARWTGRIKGEPRRTRAPRGSEPELQNPPLLS